MLKKLFEFNEDYFKLGAPVKVTMYDALGICGTISYGFVVFVSNKQGVLMIAFPTNAILKGNISVADIAFGDEKLTYSHSVSIKEFIDGKILVERIF